MEQFFRRKWLGEIIHRTGLDDFHGEFWRGVGGDHQHRQIRPAAADFVHEIVTAHPAEPSIGDDHEDIFLCEKFEACLGRFYCEYRIAFVSEQGLQGEAHVLLVIHDEQWRERRGHVMGFINVFEGKSRVNTEPFPSVDSARTVPP